MHVCYKRCATTSPHNPRAYRCMSAARGRFGIPFVRLDMAVVLDVDPYSTKMLLVAPS